MRELLPGLRDELGVDFVVVNGENAAGGVGITPKEAGELFAAGVDAITLGNHAYRHREVWPYLDSEPRIVRPANYLRTQPGHGTCVVESDGTSLGVVNLSGNLFMQAGSPALVTVDDALREVSHADQILVDMHAEATSEKMAMGHFCDGRASLVVGTHTHTPTADAQIFPSGTAYQTDAGACADYDSVIGMDKFEPVQRFVRKLSTSRYSPATGPATLCGVFVETNARGLAVRVEPVRVGGRLKQSVPEV